MSSRNRWLLVWAAAVVPLIGWWMYGLFDVDEGFYGAVVAEMNRRGEWITPYYNGKPWFEKPILLYWLAKPCLAVFGDMIGPRLPSIVCSIATYGVVAWFAKRRFSETAGQLSILMLGSSLLMVGTGRMMMTDLPLLLCLTAAMTTFWESLVDKPSWRVWTAFFLGFGVLAKGPVALILFVIIAGWTYWREPQLRPNFKGSWLPGSALLFLVIATWYVPAYLANGQLFVQKFLIEQNIGRFTGGDAAHTLPGIGGLLAGIGGYIGVLLLGMLPWSLFIWKAWPRRSEDDGRDEEDGAVERYVATWAAVVFIFFAISGAKLVHYLLPMFPPLAILVGGWAARVAKRPQMWIQRGIVCCLFVGLLAQFVFLWWFEASGQKESQALARYVRQEGGKVALYQLGRRNKDLGTGKPKLQETALPSLVMVLNQVALESDNILDIANGPTPTWIITRSNRIKPEDFITVQKTGHILMEQRPPVPQENFKLYRLK